jgi:hypothetical protein
VSDFGKFSLPAKSEALISIALRTQFVKHKIQLQISGRNGDRS